MISKTLKKVNFKIQNLKKNQKGKKIVFLTEIHKIMILTKKKKKKKIKISKTSMRIINLIKINLLKMKTFNKNYKILKIK